MKRTYTKPNMANLRGRTGREIFKAIRNTPPADFTNLTKGAEECKRKIREMEKREKKI